MEDGTQPSPMEKKKQEQQEVKGLSSFKRFLSQGEDDGTAESDVILSNTYKEEDSSVDQIQELIQMVQNRRNREEKIKAEIISDHRQIKSKRKSLSKPQTKIKK